MSESRGVPEAAAFQQILEKNGKITEVPGPVSRSATNNEEKRFKAIPSFPTKIAYHMVQKALGKIKLSLGRK